jgi:ABC-2 type transport system ATP-binding protein
MQPTAIMIAATLPVPIEDHGVCVVNQLRDAAATTDVVIKVLGASKSYGRKQALKSANLTVRRGEALAIIGPNGAGKTTLVEILIGLRTADEGSIVVLGTDMDENPEAVQRRIGVQLQDSVLVPHASVREYLKLFAALYGARPDIDALARTLNISECLGQHVGKLSGGQRQRLNLGLALIGDPELIFLDEPTTGLDPIARRDLWGVIRTLKQNGRTVILVTHYMEEVENLCDRVAVVANGTILTIGTPAQVADFAGEPGAKLDDIYEKLVSTPERAAS